MEPLQPPYDKYNMIPWDSNDTERLEPEDAEVVRKAYPPANVLNIFTKICWSPKDKFQLLARCCRIIREDNDGNEDDQAEIRYIIAKDVYTGFLIASGKKEREYSIWEQDERDLIHEAFLTERGNAYLNKAHFAIGDKEWILGRANETKCYNDFWDEAYDGRQESKEHDDWVNECRRLARDMGYDV